MQTTIAGLRQYAAMPGRLVHMDEGKRGMTSEPPRLSALGDSSALPPVQPTTASSNQPLTAGQAYNILSDTVAGLNMRRSDNLFQLRVVVVCLIAGGVLG